MKKYLGIIIAVAVVAVMVLLLVMNKARMKSETQATVDTDRAVAVRTMVVETDKISSSFSANGVVQANKELNFLSDVSGRVVEILADKGRKVQKGTPLLKLDATLYEADYKAALAAYEAMKKDEQRFTRSNEAGGVTAQQLDNIRTQLIAAESRLARSKKMYEDCTVKSPMAGTINFRYVEAGSLIAPSVPLFDIVDDSVLKITCNLPESKMRLVSVGQSVKLASSTTPDTEFTGKIKFVGIKTDRSLNYPVEISLDKNPELQIGMYLKAQFEEQGEHSGILVPRKAVVGSAKAANVYVVENGIAYLREVSLGDMNGDNVEILSGITAGDEIVTAGIMNLADGVSVNVVKE